MKTKRLATISMLLSLSVVLGLVESIIPSIGIPGIKLGLANIVILYALYKFGFKDGLLISILRVFLVGLLRTGIFNIPFFFSLLGAIFSIIAMTITRKITKLSVVGISIIGSIFHAIGQIIVAIIFTNTVQIIWYLPVIFALSIPSGIFVGMIAKKMMER